MNLEQQSVADAERECESCMATYTTTIDLLDGGHY